MSDKDIWTIKLDWLNIVNLLGLETMEEIPEFKREKAIKKITKTYGTETLLDLKPSKLDKIVVDELREVMKKELIQKAKTEEKMEREMQERFTPFKNGGIINIDPRDLKDLDMNGDPSDILKKLAKKFFRQDDDDDRDTSEDNSTGYYI